MDSDYYFISAKLREATLDYLTGLTLRAYHDEQLAQIFFKKVQDSLQTTKR